MKFRKFILLIAVIAMVLSCCSCHGKTESTTSPGTQEEDPYKGKYIIGICQFDDHISLNAATEGFKQALKDKLKDKVVFAEKNAHGDDDKCSEIVNGFTGQRVDLILANSTNALQAAASAIKDLPILGTSVTDYGVALGIKDFSGTSDRNISGTSDFIAPAEQAAVISEILPDAEKISIIYCSNEVNSVYQVEKIKPIFEANGVSVSLFPFKDNSDIEQACKSACQSGADAVYIPTDNHIASYAEKLGSLAKENKIPIFTADEGTMSECGVASLSISYYELGYKTGEMAYKIIMGDENISGLPVVYANNATKKYNPDMCEELGITIPDGYTAYKGTK